MIREYVSHAAPDANNELYAVRNLATSRHLIVANASAPDRTRADLLAAAREKPGELTLSSLGSATTQHIGSMPRST